MGWARKDEMYRLYRERQGSYIMIDSENVRGSHDGVGNSIDDDSPRLASCRVSTMYLRNEGLKRVQWNELPQEWQQAFLRWLPEDTTPESVRGFWRIGEQPGLVRL